MIKKGKKKMYVYYAHYGWWDTHTTVGIYANQFSAFIACLEHRENHHTPYVANPEPWEDYNKHNRIGYIKTLRRYFITKYEVMDIEIIKKLRESK